MTGLYLLLIALTGSLPGITDIGSSIFILDGSLLGLPTVFSAFPGLDKENILLYFKPFMFSLYVPQKFLAKLNSLRLAESGKSDVLKIRSYKIMIATNLIIVYVNIYPQTNE